MSERVYVTMADQDALKAEFLRLWTNGHAVILDDTIDCDGKLVSSKIHHYRTCVRCKAEGIER